MSLIRVAMYVVGCEEPSFTEVDNDIYSLQTLVGGYVECVPISPCLYLLCNEDGKNLSLPPNRRLQNGDMVCGNFLVCRLDRGHEDSTFASIKEEDENVLQAWTSANAWNPVVRRGDDLFARKIVTAEQENDSPVWYLVLECDHGIIAINMPEGTTSVPCSQCLQEFLRRHRQEDI